MRKGAYIKTLLGGLRKCGANMVLGRVLWNDKVEVLKTVVGNVMGHGLCPSFMVCVLLKIHLSYIICTAFSGTAIINR